MVFTARSSSLAGYFSMAALSLCGAASCAHGAFWAQKKGPVGPFLFFATLAAIAESAPQSLGDLQGISGLGVKKLEAYGAQVLRVCNGAG
jgi:superfamily II DNA helicase RecQ